jgi:hypothetical protein
MAPLSATWLYRHATYALLCSYERPYEVGFNAGFEIGMGNQLWHDHVYDREVINRTDCGPGR